MELEFEKWHGFKNDFILFRLSINERTTTGESLINLAPQLCNRDALGIGADGILILMDQTREVNAQGKPQELIILNQDGSQAAHCGNGVRCAASSNYQKIQARSKEVPSFIEFEVLDKLITSEALEAKTVQGIPYFLCHMGIPTPQKEPEEIREKVQKDLQGLELSFLLEEWGTVDIHNKHIVFFHPKAEKKHLEKIGNQLAKEDLWKNFNIHLAAPLTPSKESLKQSSRIVKSPLAELYQSWTWERGVGITEACGSGACAIGSLALLSDFSERHKWLGVEQEGGMQYIKQTSSDVDILLAGSSHLVFTGTISL